VRFLQRSREEPVTITVDRLEADLAYATAVVLAAAEARTVEEALDFLAAGKRAVEARQGFSVFLGGSA
jgi:hypothetical protein